MLAIVLDSIIINRLFTDVKATSGYTLNVDLQAKAINLSGGESFKFEVDDFRRHCLLSGLDEIGLTLQQAEKIKQYEQNRRVEQPWLFI